MAELRPGCCVLGKGAGMRDDKPERVQRKRTRGWRMPENTVYVGRPSRWGNPFTGPNAIERFKEHYASEFLQQRAKQCLRGKNLCCWCSLDKPCHADVLLRIANEERGNV